MKVKILMVDANKTATTQMVVLTVLAKMALACVQIRKVAEVRTYILFTYYNMYPV